MSLTSTLFDGLETLTAIPGGPYAAAGVCAVGGFILIGGVWRSLNPYPPHERYRPTLTSPRSAPLGGGPVKAVPSLEIPLDVIPRDEDGLTPYDVVGPDSIRTAVDQFYSGVIADPDLAGFFTLKDIERLKRHQAMLIGQLWGGPVEFPIKALADAHADLNITPGVYWKVVGHLMVVLTRLDVPSWICVFTMTRLYQARSLIISADNPLDPDPETAAAEPQTHEFNPTAPGNELCRCGQDELSPKHYAPAPARDPEAAAPDPDVTGGRP